MLSSGNATSLYCRAVRLSKNLLILLETEDQTFMESFNTLITNANVFSKPLKTVQFEYFLPE